MMTLIWAGLAVSMAQGLTTGLPWWAWLLIIAGAVIFLVWLMRRQGADAGGAVGAQGAPARSAPADGGAAAQPAPACVPISPLSKAAPPVEVAPQPDDLQIVEGIGPKIDGILKAAGILTFVQLAATDAERVREILRQAGLSRISDPATWAEQAALAAAGQWDALKELQASLKGGRRAEKP